MRRPTPWSNPTPPPLPPTPAVPAVPAPPTLPTVSKSQLGQTWTGNDESLLERVFTSTNGGLKAAYATFGSMRTRAAIRGKLQRLGLVPKRYVPSLNPS